MIPRISETASLHAFLRIAAQEDSPVSREYLTNTQFHNFRIASNGVPTEKGSIVYHLRGKTGKSKNREKRTNDTLIDDIHFNIARAFVYV